MQRRVRQLGADAAHVDEIIALARPCLDQAGSPILFSPFER
jgi:hypothetical protein